MSDMIAELKTRYDIVFFDSPPMLGRERRFGSGQRSRSNHHRRATSPFSARHADAGQTSNRRSRRHRFWASCLTTSISSTIRTTTTTRITTAIISRAIRKTRSERQKAAARPPRAMVLRTQRNINALYPCHVLFVLLRRQHRLGSRPSCASAIRSK